MKVKDLLQALVKADMEREVRIYAVEVNPYNGMRDLVSSGYALKALEADGAFIIEAEWGSDDDEG